jgi:hypothetical protein
LRDLRDPEPEDLGRMPACDVVPLQLDPALARSQQAADRAQHRRLAGAVGADDAADRAGPELDVDSLENVAAAVAGDDAFDPQQRHRATSAVRSITKSSPR